MNCWTVELTGTPLITSNMRLHHMAKYRMGKQIQDDVILLCRAQKIPRLERVKITVILKVRDHKRREAINYEPSGKAAIDGIVHAGVLADDGHRYVESVTYRLEVTGQARTSLLLMIEEIPPR